MIAVNTLFDKKSGVDPANAGKALNEVKARPTGKWLADYLQKPNVVLNFVHLPSKIKDETGGPVEGAVGYCDPCPRPTDYKVWVAAGFNGTRWRVDCPKGHWFLLPKDMEDNPPGTQYKCPKCGADTYPGKSMVDAPMALDLVSVARTTFHELLHAWFMTEFPTGTGHDSKVAPEVSMFGKVSYSSDGYDPRFLAKLKTFDKEIGAA